MHQVLRSGDSGSATDIVPFLHRTLDILRADGREREVQARPDSGFEGEDALVVLQRRGVGYVVKMRATAGVAHAANAADFALKVRARNLLVLYRDHG